MLSAVSRNKQIRNLYPTSKISMFTYTCFGIGGRAHVAMLVILDVVNSKSRDSTTLGI